MKKFNSFRPLFFFLACALAFLSMQLYAQTVIPIVNPSFEDPGFEKIKGWDGECADPNWTGLLYDIPGWTSDAPAFDSGVETGYTPTDGEWTAFVMGSDTSVYQITDYIIQDGDIIELSVDSRITWAATLMQMALFYVDDTEAKVFLCSDEYEILEEMLDYATSFKAVDSPAAIGHKLGIWFDNTSPNGDSWMGLDNVMLFNYSTTGISGIKANPDGFLLAQNFPNPFNPSTDIRYSLPHNGTVHLAVYDLLGREIAILADGFQNTGEYTVTFSGDGFNSGIYFYRLQADNQVITKKMTLAK